MVDNGGMWPRYHSIVQGREPGPNLVVTPSDRQPVLLETLAGRDSMSHENTALAGRLGPHLELGEDISGTMQMAGNKKSNHII